MASGDVLSHWNVKLICLYISGYCPQTGAPCAADQELNQNTASFTPKEVNINVFHRVKKILFDFLHTVYIRPVWKGPLIHLCKLSVKLCATAKKEACIYSTSVHSSRLRRFGSSGKVFHFSGFWQQSDELIMYLKTALWYCSHFVKYLLFSFFFSNFG